MIKSQDAKPALKKRHLNTLLPGLTQNQSGLTLIEILVAGSLTALGTMALGSVMVKMAQFKNELLIENCMASVRGRILNNSLHLQSWFLTLKYNESANFQTNNYTAANYPSFMPPGLPNWTGFSSCQSAGWDMTSASCPGTGPSPTPMYFESAGNQVKPVVQMLPNPPLTITANTTVYGFTNLCSPCLSTDKNCVILLNTQWTLFNPGVPYDIHLSYNQAFAAVPPMQYQSSSSPPMASYYTMVPDWSNKFAEDALISIDGIFTINPISLAIWPFLNDLIVPATGFGFSMVRPAE